MTNHQAPTAEVKLGKATVRVPVFRDPRATEKIAGLVSERLHQIEARSHRIDSQAYALQAAYSFAAEVQDARDEAKSVEKQMALALDALTNEIRRLLDRLDQPEK